MTADRPRAQTASRSACQLSLLPPTRPGYGAQHAPHGWHSPRPQPSHPFAPPGLGISGTPPSSPLVAAVKLPGRRRQGNRGWQRPSRPQERGHRKPEIPMRPRIGTTRLSAVTCMPIRRPAARSQAIPAKGSFRAECQLGRAVDNQQSLRASTHRRISRDYREQRSSRCATRDPKRERSEPILCGSELGRPYPRPLAYLPVRCGVRGQDGLTLVIAGR